MFLVPKTAIIVPFPIKQFTRPLQKLNWRHWGDRRDQNNLGITLYGVFVCQYFLLLNLLQVLSVLIHNFCRELHCAGYDLRDDAGN